MKLYKRFSFWTFVAVALLVGYFVFKQATASIPVRTETVKRQNIDITVTATSTGTIKSDDEIQIAAQRPGRISALYVEEGDIVKDKDPIAEIDPAEAKINRDLARASYTKARAYLKQMRAANKALSVEVESVIEGTRATLDDIEEKYRNYTELREKGFVSQMEFNELKSRYEVARTEHEAALARRNTLQAKKQEIAAQQAAVEEAGSNLELAELNYGYSFMNAPSAGVITSRPVTLGQTVISGEPLAVLMSTDSLYIEAFVDEADVSKVVLGQSVDITMDAYPDRVFQGEVYRISPVVLGGKLENRTFEVRTRIREKDVTVKPGMSADVEIVVQSESNVLVVPSQAVIIKEDGRYVYLQEDNRARLVPVTVGLSDWTNTQVLSGIEEGDEVVTTPDVPGLQDGVRITSRAPDDRT